MKKKIPLDMANMMLKNAESKTHGILSPLFLILATMALLFLAAKSPLERNQEARVLETAREMLHAPLGQWVVPRINGEIRVQKPPLAYWLSAISMKLLGETTFAGRVPFVWVVIATLWAIYRFAAKEFSRGAGQMAMWMTLGSALYASYGILAETDAISVLFVTAGIMAINRRSDAPTFRGRLVNSALAGIFTGLAAMAKGPPAFFIPLYAIALALFERKWRSLFDITALVGLALLAAIAAPWWLMVARNPQYSAVLSEELTRIRTGSNHGKPFWLAFALAGSACMPYIAPSLAMALGLRLNKGVGRCLIWLCIAMIALTFTPQKQDHYFFQIVPPVMLMTAHFIEMGYSDETRGGKTYRLASGAIAITAIGAALASPAFIIIAKQSGHGVAFNDIAFSAATACLFGYVSYRYFKKDGSRLGAVFFTLLLSAWGMQAIMHLWAPTLRPSYQTIANDMRKGNLDQSVVFYPMVNYRMNFELGKVIPVVDDPQILHQLLNDNPGMSVIIEKEEMEFHIPDFIEVKLGYPRHGKNLIVGTLKKE